MVRSVTPLNKFLLEKLEVAYQLNKFTYSYETESSLPFSQKQNTEPYFQPAKCPTHPHTILFKYKLY
jgi:hypothetical protein